MNRCAVAILFVLLTSGTQAVAATDPRDAVVQIFSTTTAGQAGLGTGFFISAAGRVLTCYHVIWGAHELKVIVGKQIYSRIQVEAIDPDHDLASLSIQGLDRSVVFLSPSMDSPLAFKNQTLETYGHPSVLNDQHLLARSTRDEFAKTQEFRNGATGARVFALRDVDLIPLDLTIYGGLSGAPLLFGNRAVGVISGSFQEGGSIAWAIPMKYIGDMKSVRRSADQVAWPPLALMGSDWKNLRKQANVGFALTLALSTLGQVVDKMHESIQPANALVGTIKRAIADRSAFVNREITIRGDRFVIDKDRALSKRLATFVDRKTGDRLVEISDRFAEVANEIGPAGTRVEAELNQYFSHLPDTPTNLALKQRTSARLKEIDSAMDQLTLMLPADTDSDDPITLGDYRLMLTTFMTPWLGVISDGYLDNMVRNLRDWLDVIEAVFEAESVLPPLVPRAL
jgi:hypothetical protein